VKRAYEQNPKTVKRWLEEVYPGINAYAKTETLNPRNRSWTGWGVRFLGCGARHNDAEWLFHSKELLRSYAHQKPCNPARSGLTGWVNPKITGNLTGIMSLQSQYSGQLRFLG
jgi:hypothetical protein